MRKVVLLACAAAAACGLRAGGEADGGGTVKLAGRGRIAIVDCGSGIDWKAAEPVLEAFDKAFRVEVVRQSGGAFSVETAAAAVAKTGSNAAVFVGRRDDYPMALACSEQRWAFVNVGPLGADGRNFEQRFRTMLMRGIYRAIGSDASQAANSTMSPVHSPSDLDAITDLGVAMDTYMAVCQSFDALGFVPVEYGTYQDGCELGIAAPPTNAVQKAIWDKVHALPTEPMKILPEKKKQR